jgi:hypothetical protein
MSRQPVHICFYSNKCTWCKAFITEVAATPYKGEFKYVCVDPSPTRPPLPSWLKKVPTLVISGEPNPRTDSEVMNWLYERKLKEGNKGGGGMILNAKPVGPAEPEPFGLMGSSNDLFSDPYTFLDQDTMAQGNGGLQGAEKNFSFLNGSSAFGTKDGGSMNTIEKVGQMSKKEQMFDNQMKNYMESRDTGLPKGPSRM